MIIIISFLDKVNKDRCETFLFKLYCIIINITDINFPLSCKKKIKKEHILFHLKKKLETIFLPLFECPFNSGNDR